MNCERVGQKEGHQPLVTEILISNLSSAPSNLTQVTHIDAIARQSQPMIHHSSVNYSAPQSRLIQFEKGVCPVVLIEQSCGVFPEDRVCSENGFHRRQSAAGIIEHF